MSINYRENLLVQLGTLKENILGIFRLHEKHKASDRTSIVELDEELKYVLQIAESITVGNVPIHGRINWDLFDATQRLNGALSAEINSSFAVSDSWANIHSSTVLNPINQFRQFAFEYLSIQSSIAISGLRIEDFYRSAKVSQEESDNLLAKMQLTIDKATHSLNEVDDIRNRIVDSSQDFAVAKFGRDYESLSDKSKGAAFWWLVGAIGLSLITIVIAVYMMCHIEINLQTFAPYLDKPAAIVFIIAPRLIIFSALFVGIGLSIKMYRANKHNQIINKHRQNALNTFETFIKTSGEDKGTKDAILLEVTRTIFGNQDTGFSGKESDSDSPNKIIEIFKGGSSS